MWHKTTNADNNPNNTNKLSEALDSYIRGCIKTEFNRNELGYFTAPKELEKYLINKTANPYKA